MGVLDKFLDIMKFNGEDDYDNDDFYDDYEDDYEEKPKKSFFKKEKNYDEEEEYEPVAKTSRAANKVTPMRQASKKSNMEVRVMKPASVDDSREIAETLLGNRTVILNLEGLDLEIAQRIIDFISGSTFAIDGNLQKISNYIFLITPTNVDISGDLQDIFSSSFNVPSMSTHY
jgi:Uncharacterized protein conserved in bacteria